MNYFSEVTKYVTDLLLLDEDVNTVLSLDVKERTDISKKNIYPLATIDVADGFLTANNLSFNVDVEILDQVDFVKEIRTNKFTTNDNTQDVYNTCLQVLVRTYRTLTNNERISIATNFDNTAPFEQVKDDKNNLIGWRMRFILEVPNDIMSICP